MLFIIEDFDIASYAADNAPCVSANNMDGVIKSLGKASTKLFQCLSDNIMKSNADNCHLLVSASVQNFDIKNSHCEELLGVKFDHELTFNSHISDLSKKPVKKFMHYQE